MAHPSYGCAIREKVQERLMNSPAFPSTAFRPVERVIAALQRRGRKVQPRGDPWTAQCPAHEDRHASLSLREGRDGRVLLNCHAGCAWRAITAALGLEVGELFPGD